MLGKAALKQLIKEDTIWVSGHAFLSSFTWRCICKASFWHFLPLLSSSFRLLWLKLFMFGLWESATFKFCILWACFWFLALQLMMSLFSMMLGCNRNWSLKILRKYMSAWLILWSEHIDKCLSLLQQQVSHSLPTISQIWYLFALSEFMLQLLFKLTFSSQSLTSQR